MNEAKKTETPKQSGKVKALILSAAVFPGLGQLSQGKKRLAIFIMAACVVCLYIILGEAMGEINATAQRIVNSGSADAYRIQQESHVILENLKTFKFLGAFYSLIGLWLFSIAEVFIPSAN